MTGFGEAEGTPIEWVDSRIEAKFSNFVYVDHHFYSSPVLRRIFSIARKLDFQSVLLEEIREENSSLLARENLALAERCPTFTDARVLRAIFFRSRPHQAPDDQSGDCLGYVVFKIDRFSDRPDSPSFHVYEAVLRPPRSEAGNNFMHCAQRFTLRCSAGCFQILGALYAQQNDLTFVCAHVALRTIIAAAVPDSPVDYLEMNRLLGIDHRSRQLGSDSSHDESGLDPDEMEKVLRSAGLEFSTILHEPCKAEFPGEFQRDLYGTIESGMPALLGFELDKEESGEARGRHIIPVLGHTFNEDTWVADASRAYFEGGLQYYPSENWLSTYLVHDDNFGPYLCLPRHFIRRKNFRISIGLVRESSNLSAVEAEAIGLNFCNALAQTLAYQRPGWLGRFAAFANSGLLVLRTLLLRRKEYFRHLKQSQCWDRGVHTPETVEAIATTLPDTFWLVEASAPELFSASRRKFGEVLLDARKPPADPEGRDLWLAARLPETVLIRDENGFQAIDSRMTSHVQLFQFSVQERNES